MTPEIHSKEWKQFCEKFTQFNRDTLLTIELIGSDGIRSELARELPLDKMTFTKTNACSDIITISLGTAPDQRKLDHVVIEPIHLRIREEQDGGKLLEIGSETGTTLVTFHSGRFPQVKEFTEDRRYALAT